MKEKSIVTNKYKCNGGLWNKMTNPQRRFYNDLRSYDKKIICPAHNVSDEAFDVLSHNYAYLASYLIAR